MNDGKIILLIVVIGLVALGCSLLWDTWTERKALKKVEARQPKGLAGFGQTAPISVA